MIRLLIGFSPCRIVKMTAQKFVITPELDCHNEDVELLSAVAFGPGRFARTAFRLREGVGHEQDLSFVALQGGNVVGGVRITRILIGEKPALILGPLVVDPLHHNEGIGGCLMRRCVETCKGQGHELIILVGDEPYYREYGFRQVGRGNIMMPGPVDPARFLYCELQPGCAARYRGQVQAIK